MLCRMRYSTYLSSTVRRKVVRRVDLAMLHAYRRNIGDVWMEGDGPYGAGGADGVDWGDHIYIIYIQHTKYNITL